MSESKSCVNCNQEVVDAYCHKCGQKYGVDRLTWRTMFDDLQKRLFGFDNNYVRTVRDLTLRPKVVVKSILDGVRVIYIGPVGFYFLMLTIYLLTTSMLDIDMTEMMKISSESIQPEQEMSEGQKQFNEGVLSTITNNFRIFSFLMVPLFALSNKIFFKSAKMNFVEHTVVVFYGLGWPFIISTVMLVVYSFTGWFPGMWASVIVVIYYAWICTSVYAKNKVLGGIKGLLAWALTYLFLIIITLIGMTIYAIINPEFIKSFAQGN